MTAKPLWMPDPATIADHPMTRFACITGERSGRDLSGFEALHTFSIEEPAAFWSAVWDFCGVVGEKGSSVVENAGAMPDARFFPEARLNFAENLLRRTGDGDALLFRSEGSDTRRMSWDELNALVSRLQQAMRRAGVKEGERVAAMMPNVPETVAFMLAAASLGAVWSSCSPDFGERGVLDRFGQIEPVLFLAPDGYTYAGKRIDVADKVAAIVEKLPSAATVVIVPCLGDAQAVAERVPRAVAMETFLKGIEPRAVTFERLAFDHPLYILFSSGTTGVPKCIVHGAGGTLLQHLKEHQLHCGVVAGDRVFYFTTCGWMMWNWLVTALASQATLCLYDGSPFHPDGNVLFDYARDERITVFGTSAKFIDAVRKSGLMPIETHDLSSVRVLASTGSPLGPEGFEFVYEGISKDVHLASVSGGTDIVACFVGAVPGRPVWPSEIQGPALGMAVDVWNDEGRPVREEKGELVCTAPFPSMPIGFWNDPSDERYRAAYFKRFPGVWCHGDFAEWTEHGGMIIHGRSDATLNPQGVRIGTAEIYNVVESMDEVVEAIAVGQEWEGDVRVVLFVRLADGLTLDEELKKRIKRTVREGCSPRHVPAVVADVADIPRTKSGKIVELAVRDVIHGRAVKNVEALANPDALDLYRDRPELAA